MRPGFIRALEVAEAERRRAADVIVWVVLVTDGRGNVGLSGGIGSDDAISAARELRESKVNTVIIDTGFGRSDTGAARELARAAGGEYVKLSALTGETISDTVRQRLSAGR